MIKRFKNFAPICILSIDELLDMIVLIEVDNKNEHEKDYFYIQNRQKNINKLSCLLYTSRVIFVFNDLFCLS